MRALFRFHKQTEALESLPAFSGLDPVHKEILMTVGSSRQDNQMLTVSDILNLTELASPATLHGRLKELRNRGFIEIVAGQDNRFKFLKPSDLANEYFNALDKCIRKSVTG